ncbi:hypothetical protein K7X08_001380 [Anisodus acutangulus]|uniref:Chorismate synthase n=1 Tax=Anisodus acutangulus TaxID=402998 RepID=A0A9Q1RKJ0_9SOLA|nr:hypothetical protein K7X08_001380 [Anisodus acutangulus]
MGYTPGNKEDHREKALRSSKSAKLLTLPTILTIGRVAAIPVLVTTFYVDSWWGPTATTGIFIAAAITDWLDGYLARKMNLGTAFGAFLDPVADKLMVAATLILLCTRPLEASVFGQLPWLLTVPSIAIIGREITISAVREWAASQGGKLSEAVAVNNLGKWKTATQMTALTILLLTRDSSLLCSLSGAGTVVASGVILLYVSAWLALCLTTHKIFTSLNVHIYAEIKAAGNTYGTFFRATTFGESHGAGIGCVIDVCPPRLPLSEADIQLELDRRRPGQNRGTTPREEADTCQISSGIADGLTTGSPIKVEVSNTNTRGRDYCEMSKVYRPSHADATYDFKYGLRSIEGGGRSSARETIGRVAAGAIAKKILKQFSGTEVLAYTSRVHKVVLPEDLVDYDTLTLDQIESNIVRCPNPEYAVKLIAAIDAVRESGDSAGGIVTCIVRNVPRQASIGFEFGSGFAGSSMTGSEHNDAFCVDENGRMRTKTNRSGGIQGGI